MFLYVSRKIEDQQFVGNAGYISVRRTIHPVHSSQFKGVERQRRESCKPPRSVCRGPFLVERGGGWTGKLGALVMGTVPSSSVEIDGY